MNAPEGAEPDAGSDAAGQMRTTAVWAGDAWVINGTKRFITNADTADFVQVMALTDREARARGGITCFLVDKGTPGFRVARLQNLMIPERPCELIFENCRVPASRVLGEVGGGMRLAAEWLSRSRFDPSTPYSVASRASMTAGTPRRTASSPAATASAASDTVSTLRP